MSVIAIAPKYNVKGKRDADEFQREAQRFCDIHDGEVFLFDNRLPFAKRRAQVHRHLKAWGRSFTPESVAFFCHGWRTGIQAGYRIADTKLLAKTLTGLAPMSVVLYCCSVARGADAGRGSFAATLSRDAGGLPVIGHDRPGHTTRNPHVWIYSGTRGGMRPVARDSWKWKAWVAALKTDYRFEFPLYMIEDDEYWYEPNAPGMP